MRKETIPQLEKTTLFKEETKQKIYAVKALEKAKKRLHCKHPREQRSYVGNNLLRCNVCGLEFS